MVYIVALIVLCVVLLALAPAALVLLGAIALIVLVIVWAKAGLRTGRWLWVRPRTALGAAEKAAWTASLVVFASGAIAMAYGTALSGLVGGPFAVSLGTHDVPVGTRAVRYSDPDTQLALKEALSAAGVTHTVETRDGKEWIAWAPKDNEAAEKVVQAVVGASLPSGRNIAFGEPKHEAEFTAWLSKRGVPWKRVSSGGKSFIIWEGDETSEKLIEAFHRDETERLQAQSKDCPRSTAGATPKKPKKSC